MFGRGNLTGCATGTGSGKGMMAGNGYFHQGTVGFMHHGIGICIGIGLIILIAVIVYLIVHKNKNKSENKQKSGKHDSAIEILKIKYVQGEITEEEFLKRRDFLEKESNKK